jgi:hypothetical protein
MNALGRIEYGAFVPRVSKTARVDIALAIIGYLVVGTNVEISLEVVDEEAEHAIGTFVLWTTAGVDVVLDVMIAQTVNHAHSAQLRVREPLRFELAQFKVFSEIRQIAVHDDRTRSDMMITISANIHTATDWHSGGTKRGRKGTKGGRSFVGS